VNTSRGPDHKENTLLMATENPTGDDRAVSLSIPARNKPFLRRVIGAARDGLRQELADFAGQLRAPEAELLLEGTAYDTLLGVLDQERVIPDRKLCAVLSRLGESVDRDNEYSRCVTEHEALRDLLGQIEGALA
jgi:hypothetical protein